MIVFKGAASSSRWTGVRKISLLPSNTQARKRVTRALVSWSGLVEAGALSGTSGPNGIVLPSWVNRTRKSGMAFVSLRVLYRTSNHAFCPRDNVDPSYRRDRASLSTPHDAYDK